MVISHPVKPKVPRASEIGSLSKFGTNHDSNIPLGNIFPDPTDNVLQPNSPTTYLPTGNLSFLLSTILKKHRKSEKVLHSI